MLKCFLFHSNLFKKNLRKHISKNGRNASPSQSDADKLLYLSTYESAFTKKKEACKIKIIWSSYIPTSTWDFNLPICILSWLNAGNDIKKWMWKPFVTQMTSKTSQHQHPCLSTTNHTLINQKLTIKHWEIPAMSSAWPKACSMIKHRELLEKYSKETERTKLLLRIVRLSLISIQSRSNLLLNNRYISIPLLL